MSPHQMLASQSRPKARGVGAAGPAAGTASVVQPSSLSRPDATRPAAAGMEVKVSSIVPATMSFSTGPVPQ